MKIKSVLVVQTAFPGDVILTLPLVQILKRSIPDVLVDMIVIPKCAELLNNHTSINEVIIYDKKNTESGLKSFLRKVRIVRNKNYDCAFIPHRSFRSALMVKMADIPKRIGFTKSAGNFLYTDKVSYDKNIHEIDRNCSLLRAIGIKDPGKEYPQLFPSFHDKKKVSHYLSDHGIQHMSNIIGIAPGTVWKTKQWPVERFSELVNKLVMSGYHTVLIGGNEDVEICEKIKSKGNSQFILNAAGKLTFLQSAELISRCRLLVTNDSAPMHLAVAMKTTVVAIFGATIPEFGFAPYGDSDIVIETKGLTCKPCSIHGGNKCPVKTFDCMINIKVDDVYDNVIQLLKKKNKKR